MVEQFGVAYAPDLPDGLLAYLRKKGYSDEEILSSGLVVQTERGLLDRFRDRLIVPIRDARGRIIAFGGRAMRADQRGKYINSPQTTLFNKSATLYALDAAKAEARRQNEVVIVEGYFDAIACHQAGLANVVASMAERFQGRLENPDGRRRFLAEALPILADEPDALTRELYLGTLSRLSGLDQETLRGQVGAAGAVRPGLTNVVPAADAARV